MPKMEDGIPRDSSNGLSAAAEAARSQYVARIVSTGPTGPWWTAVVVTAGSPRQAEHYRTEIQRRLLEGKLPDGTAFIVAPDPEDGRLGSGGATINALRMLAEETLIRNQWEGDSLEAWWSSQRVLMIHAGGDPRRLPQYSLSGRLFAALPIKTMWGEVSTVFDEILALSTAWVDRLPCGMVISPGDVLLALDAAQLDWGLPGVTAVATRQSLELAGQHGVYAIDESGRVYAFLRKPTVADMRLAGAILNGEQAAVDTGLLAFDGPTAARLMELAGVRRAYGRWLADLGILNPGLGARPLIDLYQHVTLALTGQWSVKPDSPVALQQLAQTLSGVPFRCSVVEGRFEHLGTTGSFRRALTEESGLAQLYEVQKRLGSVAPPGVESAGVIIDSVFSAECSLDSGAVAIECNLEVPVRAGRGAILHGLTGVKAPVVVPEDVVAHQSPIALPDGRRGYVVAVYGVNDDPKIPVTSDDATWFGRPALKVLEDLGLAAEQVWPDIPSGARCLWNATLFGLGEPEPAWTCACWLMGLQPPAFSAQDWRRMPRLSLADIAQWVDTRALAEARVARMRAGWQMTALSLARDGSDVRPMLALSPGISALASTGRALAADARSIENEHPTEAASRFYQASLFLGQAGLAEEAESSRAEAFRCVRLAVEKGVELAARPARAALPEPRWREVRVEAPPRIDFGGGWSDTPPFCFDWGGTVLNAALELNGEYPIRTVIRVLNEPVVRCVADGAVAEYHSREEVMAPPSPGCPFAIHRVALQMLGVPECGLEISTEVALPMGSGLGTSSILAATVLRGLSELYGLDFDVSELSDQVMCLEQRMTTGGGWQDQAGGIFPGVKLVTSGPGLHQRLRVQPIDWSAEKQAEFSSHFVLHYTGIRRIAKGLLTQVVGRYLAREVATIQVLHSIKTLAVEMAYAMREGEWDHLGRLMRRHWELNQILDPHTTNAPINRLLHELEPYLAGAKLAGAGGGGFLMLLARSPEAAAAMKGYLSRAAGKTYEFRIAMDGLRVRTLLE